MQNREKLADELVILWGTREDLLLAQKQETNEAIELTLRDVETSIRRVVTKLKKEDGNFLGKKAQDEAPPPLTLDVAFQMLTKANRKIASLKDQQRKPPPPPPLLLLLHLHLPPTLRMSSSRTRNLKLRGERAQRASHVTEECEAPCEIVATSATELTYSTIFGSLAALVHR